MTLYSIHMSQGKHLVGSDVIIKVGTWQHAGRHGEGGVEGSTSLSEGC